MGLFSKKKKEEVRNLPLLPEEQEEFPSYEAQFPKVETEEFKIPIERPRSLISESKPIYIKIEKYKSAMKTLEEIRSRLTEAEKIINNLQKLKNEEDQEFENWQKDIEELKEKLLSVDEELFEV